MERREAHTAAPEPMQILTASGKKLTHTFAECFERWVEFMESALPRDDNPDADYPTDDPREFLERFRESPKFHQRFAEHFFGKILADEQSKWVVDENRTYYKEQIAKRIWIGRIMPSGRRAPHSLHLAGEAGSGKTLLLGDTVHALTDMQREGTLEGAIAFIGHKGAHLLQQLFGGNLQQRRLERKPPFALTKNDMQKSLRYARQILGDACVNAFLPWNTWKNLMEAHSKSEADALRMLEQSIAQCDGGMRAFRASCPDATSALTILARIIANRTVILKSGAHSLADYPIAAPRTGDTGSEQENFYQGDFGRNIPRSYAEEGLVYSVPEWDLTLGTPARPAEAEVGFLSKGNIWSTVGAEPHLDFLTRTEAVVVDEAGDIPGSQFQSYFNQQRNRMGLPRKDIFVIAARAPREERRHEIPHFDAVSPRLELPELINAAILPPLALDVFPSMDGDRYPEGSPEAMRQLIERHLTDIPLFEALHLPQPREGDGFFTVRKEYASAMKELLEEMYRERGISAQVLLHTENSSPVDAGDIQGLMLADRDQPMHVVTTPALIGKALSWPNLRFAYTAIDRMSAKIAMDIARRLSHSRLHKKEKGFRTLFGQQLLEGSDPAETLYHYMARKGVIPAKSDFLLIPGQAVLSHERRVQDEKIIAKHPERYPAETVAPLKRQGSRGKRKLKIRPTLDRGLFEKKVKLPPSPPANTPAKAEVQNGHPRDTLLLILGNRGIPSENRVRCLIGYLREHASLPNFMVQSWNAWSATLQTEAQKHLGKPPEEILASMLERIQQAEAAKRRNG